MFRLKSVKILTSMKVVSSAKICVDGKKLHISRNITKILILLQNSLVTLICYFNCLKFETNPNWIEETPFPLPRRCHMPIWQGHLGIYSPVSRQVEQDERLNGWHENKKASKLFQVKIGQSITDLLTSLHLRIWHKCRAIILIKKQVKSLIS